MDQPIRVQPAYVENGGAWPGVGVTPPGSATERARSTDDRAAVEVVGLGAVAGRVCRGGVARVSLVAATMDRRLVINNEGSGVWVAEAVVDGFAAQPASRLALRNALAESVAGRRTTLAHARPPVTCVWRFPRAVRSLALTLNP